MNGQRPPPAPHRILRIVRTETPIRTQHSPVFVSLLVTVLVVILVGMIAWGT